MTLCFAFPPTSALSPVLLSLGAPRGAWAGLGSLFGVLLLLRSVKSALAQFQDCGRGLQ